VKGLLDPKHIPDKFNNTLEQFLEKGLRVIALAYADIPADGSVDYRNRDEVE
jgi:hypothetical protein